MKQHEYNKHFSAAFSALRNALRSHKTAFAFRLSDAYYNSVKTTLVSLKVQEEQFEKFVLVKQSKINNMEPGLFKNKMQEHLDKIVVYTYEHFKTLIDNYVWLLDGINNRGSHFNLSAN